MGMRRSAAAVPLGFGVSSLTPRERVAIGLAVVVVIPSVALGRHVFSLPSLVERGIAWLVPGSEGGAAKPSAHRTAAGTALSPSALVSPLLADLQPTLERTAPRRAAGARPARAPGARCLPLRPDPRAAERPARPVRPAAPARLCRRRVRRRSSRRA